MLTIQAPEQFNNAGNLPSGLFKTDPREGETSEDVLVDLRYCAFVRPPAALWCLVYGMLVVRAGGSYKVAVPEDVGVARYLKALGLFDQLKVAGAIVDDRDLAPGGGDRLIMPLTRFESESDVERLANKALETLSDRGIGAANVRPLVAETFAELAINAAEHANSPIGSFGIIQSHERRDGTRFTCAVADGGIGIRKSLEKNPHIRDRLLYDWTAIELALRERVSGTGSPTKGIGLFGVAEDMRNPGHSLLIHSGQGIVRLTEELESDARRGTLFPGTLAFASIPA